MLPKKINLWQSQTVQGGRIAGLESFLSRSCPQPPTWGAEKSDWPTGRLWGTAVSQKIPAFKLGASPVYTKILASGDKALKVLMKGACWLRQGSSTCINHLLPGCIICPIFLFLSVHVVAKCGLRVDFKWFNAALGQRSDMTFGLAVGQNWEFTTPRWFSVVHHSFSLFILTQRLKISSSAGCQDSQHLASGKARFYGHLFLSFFLISLHTWGSPFSTLP